jgi:hypothetical protein
VKADRYPFSRSFFNTQNDYQITELPVNERGRLKGHDFTAILTEKGSKKAESALQFLPA